MVSHNTLCWDAKKKKQKFTETIKTKEVIGSLFVLLRAFLANTISDTNLPTGRN